MLATKGSTLEEDALFDAGNAPLALCQAACQQDQPTVLQRHTTVQ